MAKWLPPVSTSARIYYLKRDCMSEESWSNWFPSILQSVMNLFNSLFPSVALVRFVRRSSARRHKALFSNSADAAVARLFCFLSLRSFEGTADFIPETSASSHRIRSSRERTGSTTATNSGISVSSENRASVKTRRWLGCYRRAAFCR